MTKKNFLNKRKQISAVDPARVLVRKQREKILFSVSVTDIWISLPEELLRCRMAESFKIKFDLFSNEKRRDVNKLRFFPRVHSKLSAVLKNSVIYDHKDG